ncbi:MAG: hypothetical protein K0S58_3135 [Nitrospira sp.]|jgi:hypothetical protein|nr:hypothetical protein [Nitrospira sp.]
MPPKRKVPRTSGRNRPAGQKRKGAAAKSGEAGMTRRLQDLVERIDVVLPEVAARVAALEHLLLELKLCTSGDLRNAREFVRVQEE